MFRRILQLAFVVLVTLLMLPTPALGGSANDPEILSRPNTSALLRGDVIPHLEITKGWIHADERRGEADRFRFVLEVASLPSLEDIPRDSVYVFHYTLTEVGRLYFRANWSADHSRFEFTGGMYSGCVPTVCPPHDVQGNRNYFYIPGSASQQERLQGQVYPGAPGRIAWTYPQASYVEDEKQLNGLAFKGLFAATYTRDDDGILRYADIALGVRDFEHSVSVPWHKRFLAQIPGPSPVLVIAGLVALVGTAKRLRGHDEDEKPL